MKIKIAIANYGNSQLVYLNEIIKEFKSYTTHSVDLTVYTTVPVEEKHILFPASIGTNLPHACRKDMADSINDYDLFLYDENDMLITEDNINAYIEHQATLLNDQVSGFIRYEVNNGAKILVDLNPHWGKVVSRDFGDNFSVFNDHQGGWLLNRYQLEHCINTGKFVISSHHGRGGALEQGASDAYSECGLTRVLPKKLSLLERLQVRHLPLKYTTRPEWKSFGITYENLPNS